MTIRIELNLKTGAAKLTQVATLLTGTEAPVLIVFSEAPPAVQTITLALGTAATPAVLLASVDTFTPESPTEWAGVLDVSDTPIVTYMASRGAQALPVELRIVHTGGRTLSPAHLAVTVEASFLP